MLTNSGGPVNPPRLTFRDSGFKPQLQDGGNQVRHFIVENTVCGKMNRRVLPRTSVRSWKDNMDHRKSNPAGETSGNPIPFTNPGERHAVEWAMGGGKFKDIFTEDFMRVECPMLYK